MTPRVNTWLMAGSLTLAALAPASAQVVPPWAVPHVRDYTGAIINGVMTPYSYVAPQQPTTWITPQYVVHYQAPQPVFVAWTPAPPQPAVTSIPSTVVTLRTGTTPNDVRVKPGTAVIWLNAAERDHSLVVRPTGATTSSGPLSEGSLVRPNATYSLVFREPGTYEFYLQDEPEHRGRVIVAG